jgi:uncharacterized protein YcnI
MKKFLFTAVAAVLLLSPVAALAHVTIQPPESTTGAFARFVVRVPNEHDTAATIKVEVQMPAEFAEVRYQPKPGWTRTVNGNTVTWSGGRIEHGEFDEFGFSTRMPDKAGVLAFPSIQTYENGEVVSWTGPADADKPAGRVTVAQAASSGAGGHDTGAAAPAASSDDAEDDDDGDDALPWVAVALGGVALLVSLLGMTRGRRA